ncbi:uncharacterized protein LOC113334996 isoform X3 [Papaver somniferum]|uniref:uncharacterized protein LOC113334996 isoform X3 n=1 Tax=Papaver somniferum TaxID=3469 RepID=UPI000E6F5A01|nr:uncharacterized protein LOC113334996 isoform X3 [Papaver somniferum]
MGKKLLSAVKYRASLHLVQGDNRSSKDGQNGGDCSKKLNAKKYRASLFKALVEGSSSKKDKKPDKNLKRLNDLQQGGNEGMELKGELTPSSNVVKRQRKVVHDQSGLPANSKFSSSRELEKEICGLAPIIRCPQNGKTSESCIQMDRTEQDIHLGEGYQPVVPDKTDNPVPPEVEEDGGCLRASCCMDLQPARIDNETPQVYGRDQSVMLPGQQELHREIKGIPHSQHSSDKDVFTKQQTTDAVNKTSNNEFIFTKQQTSDSQKASGSPDNEVVSTKQHVRDYEEATISLSTDISKSISLVETIYSKRKEKLLANQLKKSIQFKDERDRIEKESIAKLRKEHLRESACVRKMHLNSEVRLVELRIVDQEFIRKVQIIRNHLDTEQEKLDSMHKAARKEEKELKCHWLQEAKSGKPVDAFFVLPQLSNSCLNLDILKHCEQGHSQELISDGTVSFGLCESEVVRGHSPVAEGTNPTEPPDNSFNSSFHITGPLPYNQSNDDISVIPPDVQLQQHPPTISPSEPLGPLLSMLSNYERTVFTQADQLQVSTTANSSFEPLLLNSSSSDASVFPHALQLELPTAMDSVSKLVQSNESEENIPLDVQLQRPLPTDPPSEPGSGTPVSENSMLCQWAKVGKHVQFLKFDKELDTHEPPETENDLERREIMSGESLAQRRGRDREAQHQTKMETKDCRSIQVQRHNEGELQGRRDIEPQQPHHCCNTFAPQPPNYREREEQQQFREGKRKTIDGEVGRYTLSNDEGNLQTNTGLPDEARPIINRRAIAHRKHSEREAEQARQCVEMGAQQTKIIQERTTPMPPRNIGLRPNRRAVAQRKRREREAEQARQCAEMEVAQRKRLEREAEQARQLAEMGAQQAKKIQERTTRMSRRSLAQRRRREREAHGREMGAQKKKAVNTSFNRVTGSLGSHQGGHLGTIQNQSSCHQNPAPAAATTISTSTATQSPEKVVQHSPAIFSSNRPFSCSRGPTVNYQVGSLDSSDLLGGRTRSDSHGPATAPLLTCLTANIYDIPHSVYPRRK